MGKKPYAFSVKVVIRDRRGRWLLLRRSLSSRGNPGKWDFPGGKADPGEGFEETLLREVREETGLAISLRGVAGAAESESPTKRIAYLFMEARHKAGRVRLSSEHSEFAWVPSASVPRLDMAPQFRAFAARHARAKA